MKTIIINDTNLHDDNIQKFSNKVRAILLIENNVLVAHYGGVILLPGGSIENGETEDIAIIRELQEETGIIYNLNQLERIIKVKYYQYNYPTMDNRIINRLVTTDYYLGQYKGIDLDNIKRTERENNGDFYLEIVSLNDLLIETKATDNPRRGYFDRENKEVVKVLKRLI